MPTLRDVVYDLLASVDGSRVVKWRVTQTLVDLLGDDDVLGLPDAEWEAAVDLVIPADRFIARRVVGAVRRSVGTTEAAPAEDDAELVDTSAATGGMSVLEVARVLRLTPETVRKIEARALHKLRLEFERIGEGDDVKASLCEGGKMAPRLRGVSHWNRVGYERDVKLLKERGIGVEQLDACRHLPVAHVAQKFDIPQRAVLRVRNRPPGA